VFTHHVLVYLINPSSFVQIMGSIISSAAKLLDFLLAFQQDLYTAEQVRELPTWAHPPRRFVNVQVNEDQPLRLVLGTIITSNTDEQ